MKRTIVVIAGPTAVGKTEYSISIAEFFDGEIVSADSMQLYQFMNIGSAKPTKEELATVKHHLVDEIDPREEFSVALYQRRAKKAIEGVLAQGKLPFISGGTGLYINSLLYDMDFSIMPKRSDYRKQLEGESERFGNGFLHEKLRKLDPSTAERIHPNNIKKIIRALEVIEGGGEGVKPFEQSFVKTKDYATILIGLTRNREELYDRINQRVDLLIQSGLEEEIRSLMQMGLTEQHISMKGIGYKEMFGYFNGEYPLNDAVELIKRNTRRYAKRQLTWFRRYEDIHWINLSHYTRKQDALEEIVRLVQQSLKGNI